VALRDQVRWLLLPCWQGCHQSKPVSGYRPGTLVDGEIVAQDANGRASFNLLQRPPLQSSSVALLCVRRLFEERVLQKALYRSIKNLRMCAGTGHYLICHEAAALI
jgi:hypothetical protein